MVDTDKIRRTFAANLVRLREEQSMSQMDLALESDIDQHCISAYESGKHLPGTPALCKLAEFFGVTETELLHGGEIDA